MPALFFFYTLLVLLLFGACQKEVEEQKVVGKQVPASVSLTDLGNEEWRMGNYQKALDYFTQAYKKVKEEGNKEQMATLLNNLGLVHWRLENNDAAMECYDEAAALATRLDMKRLLGLTYTNRALILKEQRDFEKAFASNEAAIAIFKELNEPRDLAIAYNNQGQIYRYGENLDAALNYYLLSLEECRKIDYKEGIATAWQNLGTVYTQKGDAKKAFNAARRCLAIARQLDSKVRIREACEELSKSHERFGTADSALYYYKKYFEVERELMEANQSERLSQNQAELGLEVKNLRIQNLQNEKDIANNRLLTIAFGVLAVLMVVALFIYRYFSRMRFKERQLEMELHNTQKIIDVKEQELKTYIIDLSRKNAIISSLQEGAAPKQETAEPTEEEIAALLEQKILTDDDWAQFQSRFRAIYPGFFSRIKESGVALTEAETRILVLMRLELNGPDMADILGISPQSVRVCKMRLKKKLPSENYETVEAFLEYLIR
ncbi:tetratricopeptide repeat protein [Flavobacterium sp.]|uniref:tetratricopeptide repeat protein n=1 Tax=Flavobacterium sp. TaxID=239 RepID=UPI0040335F9D